jgi:hypothetical protein
MEQNRNSEQRFQPYQRNNAPYQNSHQNTNNYNQNRNNNYNNNNNHQNSRNERNNQKYFISSNLEASLYIHPYSKYDAPFPKFSQPTEVGVIISERKTKMSL